MLPVLPVIPVIPVIHDVKMKQVTAGLLVVSGFLWLYSPVLAMAVAA